MTVDFSFGKGVEGCAPGHLIWYCGRGLNVFFLPLIEELNTCPPYAMFSCAADMESTCMCVFFSSEINISELWCVNISVVTYSCEINI